MEIMKKSEYFSIFYLSCFGLGKIKFAPGTFGSLFALIVLFISENLLMWLIFPLIIVNIFVSFVFINSFKEKYGKDPKWIVQDEVIGMWISISSFTIPHNLIWITIAFVLFRFFDIFKPYPINKIDQKSGAIYILLDDVIAGIFSLITLHFLYFMYEIFPFLFIFIYKL